MDLTEKEAFQLGFMYRCAEEGLTGEKLLTRIKHFEKVANWDALKTVGSGLGQIASVPILSAITLGGLAGHVAGTTSEPPVDENDLKAKELIATYKAYAARAKAKRKNRQYRPSSMV